MSESGSLFAGEATDGTESWRVDFGDQFLSATPAVADGVVYAGANETFRALDAADGSELWRATFDGGRILQSIPAVADGRAFVNSGETLHAFDAADGTELWTRRIGGAVVMTLAVDGDTVYAVGGDYVYAFDVADGTRHWRADVGFGRWVVVGDDAVFARGANDAIVALDPEDGAELWRQAGVDSTRAPAVAGEYLFVGDFEGRISAIGPVPE